MFQNTSRMPNSRFAWLTPLAGQNNSNGPWLLTDNDTFRVEQDESITKSKITVKALLDILMGVLDVDSPETQLKTEDQWQSDCKRYLIRWHKQTSDTSRLFIQQRSDYFARVELYIDDNLLVAYQEPVWPHLQRSLPTKLERLTVPSDCIRSLQAGNRQMASHQHQLPKFSANQDTNDTDENEQAA